MSRALILIAAVVLSPLSALAQQDHGVLAGRVIDASGGVLPGASVTARRDDGAVSRTQANAEGHYALPPLAIGRYRVTIELPGFKRAVSHPIDIHATARVRLDVQLEIGPVSDTVAVRGGAPLLDTDISSLGYTIGAAQIARLPVIDRNFNQLAMLAAGVLPAFGHFDREAGFNANGQWSLQNNFILDGVDNNSHVMSMQDRKAQVLVPNLDAVQEFQVQTSNYSAEFGRGAGAVMNVSIKSGSNSVRGTAHEYLRNDAFDARNAFDYDDRTGDGKPDPDALRRNQMGFTIGGPIRRNRSFYFGSLEVTSIHTRENSLVTVPSALERLGIFDPNVVIIRDPATGLPFPGNVIPQDRWDPVAARLIGLWPEPNFAGPSRANFVSSPAQRRLRGQFDVRIDHTFSSRDRMFLRVSRMHFRGERQGPFPSPAVGGVNNDVSRDANAAFNVALSETHIFRSSLVHEARLGVNSLRTNKRPVTEGFPNETFGLRVETAEPIEGLARLGFVGSFPYAPLGEAQSNPNDKTAGTIQFLENFSIATGRHTIRAGADLRWIQSSITGAPLSRGIFTFNGRFTGASLGDFLLGMTSTRQFGTMLRGDLRERNYMLYVQDDWRIARHLTFNLGLRYELASPKFDTADRMSTLDTAAFPGVRVIMAGGKGSSWAERALVPTDTNNWAPRLGVSFQPGEGWTLRGAAGVFYGTPRGVGPAVHLLNNWPHSRNVTLQSTPSTSAGRLADGIDGSLLGDASTMPLNLTWNVWSPDFSTPTITQWNMSAQRQLARTWVLTAAYVGSASRHLQRLSNINAAGPGDGGTERRRRPIPDLGAITMTDSSGSASYHALQTTLERRVSDGAQGSLSYTWSHSIDDVTEALGAEGSMVIQDPRNIRGDRGNSGFDRRHRLAAHGLVALPFGWHLSGILSMQSGAWFDVTILDPSNRLGVTPGATVWRPDLVGDPRPANPSTHGWLNPEAFQVPQDPGGTYRYGNLGRNSLLGPGYFNLDAGLTKEFVLGSGRRLQLRWEVFNVTNHPSFGLPNSLLGSPEFGIITTTVSNARQMQFGLKFLF